MEEKLDKLDCEFAKALGCVDHVDSAFLNESLFNLISIFRSQNENEILSEIENVELRQLKHYDGDFARPRIVRHLVLCAIMLRMLNDGIDENIESVFEPVGVLIDKIEDGNLELSLSLREACNKIIHAQILNFDINENIRETQVLNPTIYIYGRKGKYDWKAILDVKKFVAKGIGVLNHQRSMLPY